MNLSKSNLNSESFLWIDFIPYRKFAPSIYIETRVILKKTPAFALDKDREHFCSILQSRFNPKIRRYLSPNIKMVDIYLKLSFNNLEIFPPKPLKLLDSPKRTMVGEIGKSDEDVFAALKARFKTEIAGIDDINELRDVFAAEIAKRDKLLAHLEEQNRILVQSALRSKKEDLER